MKFINKKYAHGKLYYLKTHQMVIYVSVNVLKMMSFKNIFFVSKMNLIKAMRFS